MPHWTVFTLVAGGGLVVLWMMCNRCSPRGFYGQDNICIIILQYWNGSFRGGWGISLPEKWLLPSTNWLLQHKYDILGEGDLLLVVMDSCYHTIFLVSGYCGVHRSELSLCLLPSLGFVRRTQSCLWYLIASQTRKWSWWPSSGCWEEYLQLYGGEGRRRERDKLEGGSYLHMYVTTNTLKRDRDCRRQVGNVVQSVLWDNWAQTLAAMWKEH